MPQAPEATKPAWVEALDDAKRSLFTAASSSTPEEADAHTRRAYAWMDIAKLLKG